MASWVVLTLDTHAPRVTFGAPDTSDSSLTLPYAVDEPAVTSAWVIDAANQRWELAVGAYALTAVLPNAATGWATVYAHAVDSVGNAATYTVAVMLIGGVGPPPTPPPPGLTGPGIRPARIAPRPRKYVTARTRLRASCTSEPRQLAQARTAAATVARASSGARATASSQLAVASSARAGQRIRGSSQLTSVVGDVALRRGDGDTIALLLDL